MAFSRSMSGFVFVAVSRTGEPVGLLDSDWDERLDQRGFLVVEVRDRTRTESASRSVFG